MESEGMVVEWKRGESGRGESVLERLIPSGTSVDSTDVDKYGGDGEMNKDCGSRDG